jgi:hypothetical protein
MPTSSHDRGSEQEVDRLKQMKAPRQTLIVFAHAVSEIVSDQAGGSNGGLFTKYLIKHIITPGLRIEAILTRVANDVASATHNLQTPLRVNTLISEEIHLIVHGKPIYLS